MIGEAKYTYNGDLDQYNKGNYSFQILAYKYWNGPKVKCVNKQMDGIIQESINKTLTVYCKYGISICLL